MQEETEDILLYSEFQGKFLQNLWDVLMAFETVEQSQKKLKQFGKMNYYKITKNADQLTIQLGNEKMKTYSYEAFYADFYNATKRYLNIMKRENPRIALDDLFQQLITSCYYYERNHEPVSNTP